MKSLVNRRALISELKQERADLEVRLNQVNAALTAFGAGGKGGRKTSSLHVSKVNREVIAEVKRALARLGGSGSLVQIYVEGDFRPRSKGSVWDHIKASDEFHIEGKGVGKSPFIIRERG